MPDNSSYPSESLSHDDDAWLFIDLSIGNNFFHRLVEFKSTTSDPNYAASISMSTNGSRIVISGSESTGENNMFRGFAKLYTTDNTLLHTFETDSIEEVAPTVNVAISGDGEKLAIGAVFPTGDSESVSGVKVYDLSGEGLANYAQIGSIIAAGKMGDLPGLRLDMSEDGSRVTVGGRNHGDGRGRVRVYKIDTSTAGSNPIELIFDKIGVSSEDHLGSSVSTSKTGKYLAVGGTGIPNGSGSRTGAVEIYDTDTNSMIGNVIYGKSSNDAMGFSVDLVQMESVLYVAIASIFSTGDSVFAVDNQTADRGKVDIYKYSLNSENSGWAKVGLSLDGERGATLDFNNGRYHIGDSFGFSLGLAMTENGGLRVAVGSPFFSNVRESDAYYGVVKLFEFSSEKASWEQVAYDIVGKSKTSASGTSVALVNGGDTLAIGGGPDGTSMGNVIIYVQDETSSKPSAVPSSLPSSEPSTKPSIGPSSQPSSAPSKEPSSNPSIVPSSQPSFVPSGKPSTKPSGRLPSSQPSYLPSEKPSSHPSDSPSSQPSSTPSRYPSNIPTTSPSVSYKPSNQPSAFVERGFMILSKFQKFADLPMDGREDKHWCLERLLAGGGSQGNPLKMRPCEEEEIRQTWFYDRQTKVITSGSEGGEFCITRNGKQLEAKACGSSNADTLISPGALNLSQEGDATQGSISMKKANKEFYFVIDSIKIFSRIKLVRKGTENSSFDKWQLRYKGPSDVLNHVSGSIIVHNVQFIAILHFFSSTNSLMLFRNCHLLRQRSFSVPHHRLLRNVLSNFQIS